MKCIDAKVANHPRIKDLFDVKKLGSGDVLKTMNADW